MNRRVLACALLLSCTAVSARAAPTVLYVSEKAVGPVFAGIGGNIGGTGNAVVHRGSAFEPVIFRDRYTVIRATTADRADLDPEALSRGDTYREALLDGADVRVYRFRTDGVRMVRRATVRTGGHRASGYLPVIHPSRLLAATATSWAIRWSPTDRPGVRYWFAVRAVRNDGARSDSSNPVCVERPTRDAGVAPAPSDASTTDPSSRRGRLQRLLDRMWSGHDTKKPDAPTLRARHSGDSIGLEWDASADPAVIGYVVERSDTAPSAHRGFGLDLSPPARTEDEALQPGDWLIVSRPIMHIERGTAFTNHGWGDGNATRELLPGLVETFADETPGATWALVDHKAGTPVEEPGRSFLRVEQDGHRPFVLRTWNHAGTSQAYYDVLAAQPYTVEVWLRCECDGRVRFRLRGFYEEPGHQVAPIEFVPGPHWAKHVARFVPPVVQTSMNPGAMTLELIGAGRFDIDNFRVYRSDASFLAQLPEDHSRLIAAHPTTLRMHASVKTGRATYDMRQWVDAPGASSRTARANTLPQGLRLAADLRAQPWLQVEWHMAPEEWLGLVEYLAAPYDPAVDRAIDRPWAALRVAQGRSAPWTDAFDRIVFELGNETWNPTFAPWTFEPVHLANGVRLHAGTAYGMFQQSVIDQLSSSPWWHAAHLDEKMVFTLGGLAGSWFGAEAAAASPSSRLVTISAYIGAYDGIDAPAGPKPETLARLARHFDVSGRKDAEWQMRQLGALTPAPSGTRVPGVYEAGPDFLLNGLNDAKVSERSAANQERAMKGVASASAVLDAMLGRAQLGFSDQAYFTLERGLRWTSHSESARGGRAFAPWQWLEFLNAELSGGRFHDVRPSDRPCSTSPCDFDDARVYAIERGDTLAVVMVSHRSPTGASDDEPAHNLEIRLPWRSVRRVERVTMVGGLFDDGTSNAPVRIERTSLDAARYTGRLPIDSDAQSDEPLRPSRAVIYLLRR